MSPEDPLAKFIVDETEAPDVSILSECMNGFVKITTTGKFIFSEAFRQEPGGKRVLRYLLAKKIAKIKVIGADGEGADRQEIAEQLNMDPNAVNNYMARELKSIIRREHEGKYSVPNYNLYECQKYLTEDSHSGK